MATILPALSPINHAIDKQTPQELEVISSQLAALIDVGLAITAERDPVQLAQLACGAARKLLGTQYAFLVLLPEPIARNNEKLTAADCVVYKAGFTVNSFLTREISIAVKQSLLKLLAEGRLLQLNANDEYLQTCGWPLASFPVENMLTLPMLSSSYCYGQLCVINNLSAACFSEQNKHIANTFATSVALAYENLHHCAIYQKETERLLQQQQTESAQVARTTAMGEIASRLVHELTQPLTAIATYVHSGIRYLKSQNYQVAELLKIMTIVAQQSERAGEIIHRMREFLHTGELQFESVKINELVEQAASHIEFKSERPTITWQFELAPNLPRVVIERLQIEQVLINIIRNAVEAMEGGNCKTPRITIRTQQKSSGEVTVSVSDNGPGIKSELLANLFQPYVTSKKQGMGLGLAISRTIIEAHGGQFVAVNLPEGGTCFYFTLPTATEHIEA